MARKPTLLQSNFSSGEVSDLFEARPDVGKRYNAVRQLENFWLYPEGGAYRRPGTKFICEVKDSSKFTLLMPFEFATDDAFIIEAGEGYFRFVKNRAQVMSGVVPYEVGGSPYLEANLRNIERLQSADFLFMADGDHEVQKLARLTDTNWSLADFRAVPPPSFDADENFGVVGAPSANTGAVKWRIPSDGFLAGDVDRRIVAGAGVASITAIDGARQVTIETTSDFNAVFTAGANTLTSAGTTVTDLAHGRSAGDAIILTSGPQTGEIRIITTITTADIYEIDAAFSVDQTGESYEWTVGFAAGQWLVRGAPQVTLDVNKKEPVGAIVNLVFGNASARTRYIGMFVKMLGGTIEIISYTDTTHMTGIIRAPLTEATTANPAVVDIGAWRLHQASWSDTRGWPQAVEEHQGRLCLAGTRSQPRTVWGANLYDIYNFAVGSLATDSYEFKVRASTQDPITSLASLGALYVLTPKDEHAVKGQGVDTPIGGDEAPLAKIISDVGSQRAQPVVVDNVLIMLQALKSQITALSYSLSESADAESFVPTDLTLFARHIGEMGFAQHMPAYFQIPNTTVFFPLNNGQLGGLIFKPRQEVAAWCRTVTDGEVESIAIVPRETGQGMVVHLIVKRVINGATKRFIEYFEDNEPDLSSRSWSSLYTDCAVTGTITAGTATIAVAHLEGETVDVIIGESAVTQKVVTAGIITLDPEEVPEADTFYEVGLHYDATLTPLRPSIPNEPTDMLKRSWKILMVRVKNTIGGKINGKPLKPQRGIAGARMVSGLVKMENLETTDPYDGALPITQDQPYPMTVLNICGQVVFADEAT